MATITVLVDDHVCKDSRAKPTHGLSLYVEFRDKHILFDTGPSPDVLQFNTEELSIDLELIDFIVISHAHADHYGGLPHVGWINPLVETFIPYGSWETIGVMVKKNDLRPVEIVEWHVIDKNIEITRPLHGPPYEHFLILHEDRGLIVLTGCFHPQPSVLKEVAERSGKKPRVIVGGLHFSNAPQHILESAISVFREVGVEKIAPLHCTNERLIRLLENSGFDIVADSCCGGVFKV